jgi:hypothetical protein
MTDQNFPGDDIATKLKEHNETLQDILVVYSGVEQVDREQFINEIRKLWDKSRTAVFTIHTKKNIYLTTIHYNGTNIDVKSSLSIA